MDSLSLSNSFSKNTILENTEMSTAYFEDLKNRKDDAISNERIQKGDTILDTYKVTSDAISGGMGSVWRVHHKSWNTDLAMKRPQPGYFAEGSEKRKEQFIDECEHWINLGLHPNIVSCYYVREIGGVPTIFSEWMDGGSLSDRIKDGSLYEGTEEIIRERILDIAIQAARGLQYSHENGLIHKDMKPGNLLLSKDWDAKVADFGLAKAKEQLEDKSETAKTTGYTPEYCPKEQRDGEESERWMDVYAWALTVLEMYAGKRLWDTGAEAKEHFDDILYECRFAVSERMRFLLRSCLNDRPDGFDAFTMDMEQIYREITGRLYGRKTFEKVRDSAATINNRALSFLDIGQTEIALELLKKAAQMDSPMYNPAKWNLYLFCARNGLDLDDTQPELGEEIFWQMEQGDLESVLVDSRIVKNIDEEKKDGDEEYRAAMSRLKELLREQDAFVRDYNVQAAYLRDNQLLIGCRTDELIPKHLHRINLDNFEETMKYELPDGDIGYVYFDDKYTYATTGCGTDYDRNKRPIMGVYIWDTQTGEYLRYIEGNIQRKDLIKTIQADDKLYSINKEYDIPTATCIEGDFRELMTKGSDDIFADGYGVRVKRELDPINRPKTNVVISLDGDPIDSAESEKRNCERIFVDPVRQRILLLTIYLKDIWRAGIGPKHFYRLMQLRHIPYTAPYLVSRVRSSAQASGDYEIFKNAAASVPRLLKKGQVAQAIAAYENVRDKCWNLGYNKEILDLELLLRGHAIPTGVDMEDALPYTEYADYVYIPAETYNKERFYKGRGIKLERTFKGRAYGYLNSSEPLKPVSVDENDPYIEMHPVWEVSTCECMWNPSDPEHKYFNYCPEPSLWERYRMPEGDLYGVFLTGDCLLFQLIKPLYLKTDYAVMKTDHSDGQEENKLIPQAYCLDVITEMYRMSLADGSIEKIGEGSGRNSKGRFHINGIADHGSEEWGVRSVSYDGRLWMQTETDLCYSLKATIYRWKPIEGRLTEPVVTIESAFEKNKQNLLDQGIHLYELDEEVPVPTQKKGGLIQKLFSRRKQ